jgi:type I restriction enzyme M protein
VVDKIAALDAELAEARKREAAEKTKQEKKKTAANVAKLESASEKLTTKLAERDERVAEVRRREEDDRKDVAAVGSELVALYADPDELLKHARVVGLDEIEENEFNLNIPRYVDTFDPEPRIEVGDALKALHAAEGAEREAGKALEELLAKAGYATY